MRHRKKDALESLQLKHWMRTIENGEAPTIKDPKNKNFTALFQAIDAGIVVSEPDYAFGWLHPDFPYPICAKAKLWPNMRRHIESATWEAARGQRNPMRQNKDVVLAMHEHALRLNFDGHPQLARRFAAIRYPIVGDCLSDLTIQALHRVRAAHSIIPAS